MILPHGRNQDEITINAADATVCDCVELGESRREWGARARGHAD